MPVEPNTPVPLTYQESRPLQRRKRLRRAILVICFLGAATAFWYRRETIWNDAKFLYWQHRCLNYSPPEDQVVVLQDDSQTVTTLQKNDPTYGTWGHTFYVQTPSPSWDRYQSLLEGPLAGSVSGVGGWKPTIIPLFMHERRSPHGKKRLVAVFIRLNEMSGCWMVDPKTFPVSNFREKSELIRWDFWSGLQIATKPWGSSAKFFAGQIDPNDASRFTIRYTLDGVPGTIEGQLQDDNVAHLGARDGPAAGRPEHFP